MTASDKAITAALRCRSRLRIRQERSATSCEIGLPIPRCDHRHDVAGLIIAAARPVPDPWPPSGVLARIRGALVTPPSLIQSTQLCTGLRGQGQSPVAGPPWWRPSPRVGGRYRAGRPGAKVFHLRLAAVQAGSNPDRRYYAQKGGHALRAADPVDQQVCLRVSLISSRGDWHSANPHFIRVGRPWVSVNGRHTRAYPPS